LFKLCLFATRLSTPVLFRGCDACEEWYHGDCINITEKDAKHIKQFFCVVSEVVEQFFLSNNKRQLNVIIYCMQRCREEDPTLVTRYKPRRSDQDDRKHRKYKDKEKEKGHRYEYDAPWGPSVEKKSSKRCGECTGCLRVENCGKCDACR
jgi:COMPASS component SPP1